ncbi:hypothetical protein HPB49_022432 [Dermacentor silvarum]|uniref:Uncharacterized protein n=1 Tax=Dermacentor silvarum TaxID=543639 RepID=A0ACB8E3U6_DERSI|nr:hypothetical protein HPB49_022432 [Dermacentor silvarum]
MRYSGPPRRRRVAAPGRIPPIWATRSTRRHTLWPPRYRPLGSLYFVPFQGGGPVEAPGACGGPSAQANMDTILPLLQFEWNGCTFGRYIPAVPKGATAAVASSWHMATPGDPPMPTPPFGWPKSLEWHQRHLRSQSRRGWHQQVFPWRAPAPPWTLGSLPQDRPGYGSGTSKRLAVTVVGAPEGGSGPYRPRDQNNPEIPRKENKMPASHMHLPPFLAMANKLPSPTTATHVPRHPPGAAAFRNKNSAAAAPLPSSLRVAFGGDDSCASPALSKRNEVSDIMSPMNQASGSGGNYRAGGGDDGGVPESDALGVKPKKPPRMNMKFTKSSSERSGGNAPYNSGNKAFARAPPFGNVPRHTV